MLVKLPTSLPGISCGWSGKYWVQLAAGMHCPNCASRLYASGVDTDDIGGEIRLICSTCHKDVLVLRKASSIAAEASS